MGEKVGTLKDKRVVFVTVGTTCFDALVRAVDTPQVKNELFWNGYTNILIQMGRGSYIPNKLTVGNGSAVLEYFTFSSSIADYLKEASLVISHAAGQDHVITRLKVPAGSGSIFETLRLGKPLIVVVNEDLMDTVAEPHRTEVVHPNLLGGKNTLFTSELAEELADRKHLLCARPQTLYETIVDMDTTSLVPYKPGDAEPVAKLINRYLGFPDD